MTIKVRWLLGIVAVAAVVFALCLPRWRLCKREIRQFEAEERLLRAVVERIDRGMRYAASKGDMKEVAEMAKLSDDYRKLADRRAIT